MKRGTRPKNKVLTSEREIAKAVAASRAREKRATKILSAYYDRRRDFIVVELSTGSSLTIPRQSIPGFAKTRPTVLRDLRVTASAEGVWSDEADDGVLLEQMIILAAGETTVASIGARVNASKKSPARAAASRANGAKGGRPRKRAA